MLSISVSDINLCDTFLCGQTFRNTLQEDGSFICQVGATVGRLALSDNMIIISSNFEDEGFWREYLDLGRDYVAIRRALSKDGILSRAVSDASGIKLLKQPFFECLISFIISQNNNIPRIRGIIERLCALCGDEVEFESEIYYSFPSPEQILSVDLAPIRAGFREKYIRDACERVIKGEIDEQEITHLSVCEAQEYLQRICGVGKKVADCVLLFACQKFELFPTDVLIKRVMQRMYGLSEEEIPAFAEKEYGDLAGFAQQYLYYHMYKTKGVKD